jgi:Ca2+-binding RTX toxin-like protein
MSLLSRSTRGGKRVAAVSAATALTLFTWLVIAAMPASAISPAATTCVSATSGVAANDILDVQVHADDRVGLSLIGGFWVLSLNGSAFNAAAPPAALAANCPATATTANVDFVRIVGSDAGNEVLTLYRPANFSVINTSIDLGNGATDQIVFEFGPFNFLDGTPQIVEPGTADSMRLAAGVGSTLVGDLNAGGVNDAKFANTEIFTINGGDGNDTVDAGTFTGTGSSTITPVLPATFTDDDVPASAAPFPLATNLIGGNGDDTLVSGNGNDNFQGGPGADWVDYRAASGAVVVDLTAATGTGMGSDTLADVQNINGGPFGDTLTGNALDNEINGFPAILDTVGLLDDGGDTINGVGGNDTLNGWDGSDTILQGTAADGHDTITGGTNGAAGDTLDYSGRTNALYVAPGAGGISGEGGCPLGAGCEGDAIAIDIENYLLGSGADNFVGSGADEWVQGNAGDDVVDGNGGTDTLDVSEATTDVTFDLTAGTANGDGNDTFFDLEAFASGTGNDSLVWNGVTPAALADFFSDGGTDVVDATSATVGVVIDLSTLGNGQEVENANGGSGNDTLIGNVLNNRLFGNDGFDVIAASTGNDFVEGGADNDTISDGGGADTLSYKNAPSGVEVDTANGFAEGGDGSDTLAGIFETVLGSNFDDSITGGQSSVDVPNKLKGRGGDDSLIGTNSTDQLLGGAGNDDIRGGNGDDILKAGAGDDLLLAGSGDDRLKGGSGDDTGVGGSGFDVCAGVEDERSCEG